MLDPFVPQNPNPVFTNCFGNTDTGTVKLIVVLAVPGVVELPVKEAAGIVIGEANAVFLGPEKLRPPKCCISAYFEIVKAVELKFVKVTDAVTVPPLV